MFLHRAPVGGILSVSAQGSTQRFRGWTFLLNAPGHHNLKAFGHSVCPHTLVSCEAEWEGGIFFQMKVATWSYFICEQNQNETKQNKDTELDYTVSM